MKLGMEVGMKMEMEVGMQEGMEVGMQEGMEVAPINKLLPAEILEKVFRLLPPRALKMVVLVCRRWRQVRRW